MITKSKRGWIVEWTDRVKRDWVSYEWYPELAGRSLEEMWNDNYTVGEYICGLVRDRMVVPGQGYLRRII